MRVYVCARQSDDFVWLGGPANGIMTYDFIAQHRVQEYGLFSFSLLLLMGFLVQCFIMFFVEVTHCR